MLFQINRTGYFRIGRTLVLPVINIDTFGFLIPFQSLWGHKNMCFLFMMCYMTVRRPNLEKRFSISRYEYRVSFSVMSDMEMCLLSYFWRYEFVKVHDFSAKVIKVTFRISVSNTHILCLLFYPTVFQLIENLILLKVRKLYNFELHNALQFSFNDIRI